VCCKSQDSSIDSPSSPSPVKLPAYESALLSSTPDLPDGSSPRPDLLKQIAQSLSKNQKSVSAVTVAVLSTALIVILHPILAAPAFAAFQTAAKTGSAAAETLISTEFLSSAWTGFFAGCLHTLSGPDHLAALAPLSIGRSRTESAAVGALWGCGHDAGQLIFGAIFLLLKDRLHIEVIRTWGSCVVGFTLLLIGFMGIKEVSGIQVPVVALETGEISTGDIKKNDIGLTATFATGLVHGLQPDALMMVLPALALPSRLAGAAFLGMFLVGTVVSMGSYTVFIGSCSRALKDRIPRITEKLTWASSVVAIALGFAIILSQYFGFSLY
jgi:sulfite exporter TauE/SafE